MGRRGPKSNPNMTRKWWLYHNLTIRDIEEIATECQKQLPLLAPAITPSLVISAMAAQVVKKIHDETFDADEFLKSFSPPEEDADEEPVEDVHLNVEPGTRVL